MPALVRARRWTRRVFLSLTVAFAIGSGGAVAAPQQAQADAAAPTQLAAIDPRTPAAPPSTSRRFAEPFGLTTARAPEGGLWTKWRNLQADIRAEAQILARCRAEPDGCPPAARRFLAIVKEARAREGRARLGSVNRAINLAIRPVSDLVQHGVIDVWTAPLATLAAGAGDCEDYAIAKYVALREAGVPDEDLRLVIVRDMASGEDHAILTARLDGGWLVLDNRRFLLLEATEVSTYRPLFALDHAGVRRFGAPDVQYALQQNPASASPASSQQEPAAPSAGPNTAPLLM